MQYPKEEEDQEATAQQSQYPADPARFPGGGPLLGPIFLLPSGCYLVHGLLHEIAVNTGFFGALHENFIVRLRGRFYLQPGR